MISNVLKIGSLQLFLKAEILKKLGHPKSSIFPLLMYVTKPPAFSNCIEVWSTTQKKEHPPLQNFSWKNYWPNTRD